MTKRRPLTISFLNVCSIRYKLDEIRDFIESRGISIFAVAETWLKPDIADGEVDIPHFNLFRKDRINHRGGGVALYCHEDLQIRKSGLIWKIPISNFYGRKCRLEIKRLCWVAATDHLRSP